MTFWRLSVELTAECLTESNWTQKTFDKTGKGLSIGIISSKCMQKWASVTLRWSISDSLTSLCRAKVNWSCLSSQWERIMSREGDRLAKHRLLLIGHRSTYRPVSEMSDAARQLSTGPVEGVNYCNKGHKMQMSWRAGVTWCTDRASESSDPLATWWWGPESTNEKITSCGTDLNRFGAPRTKVRCRDRDRRTSLQRGPAERPFDLSSETKLNELIIIIINE